MAWTFDALNSLVTNQVPESSVLEYKGSMALAKTEGAKKEISKDVSALANSAGGTVIYGIEEKDHLPSRIDDGVDPSDISKEWLEQIINSRIQRKIDGIVVHQIQHQGYRERVLYVVEVPQSSRAPHQASDKKFYKRFNFMAEPMEEYEVRDVSRRAETPDLVVVSDIVGREQELHFDSMEAGNRYGSIDLRLTIINRAIEPAAYAVVNVNVPEELGYINAKVPCSRKDGLIQAQYVHGNRNSLPLFDGIRLEFMDSRVKIFDPPAETYVFTWDVRSPKMEVKRGAFRLSIRREGEHYFGVLNEANPSIESTT